MATAGVINGKNLGLWVNGTLIGVAKSAKISVTHEVRDTTSKDDNGWKTSLEGGRSWKADCDGLVAFDATFGTSELYAFITNRTQVGISFETNVSGDDRYYGSGYLVSLELDAPNQESVTYTASFEGTGALTQASHT